VKGVCGMLVSRRVGYRRRFVLAPESLKVVEGALFGGEYMHDDGAEVDQDPFPVLVAFDVV